MKRIREFAGPVPGLNEYLAHAGANASWRGYRRDVRYQRLAETLSSLQHGLCGYCENDIRGSDRQVEHVVPRSHPLYGRARTFDAANMIACCQGGTSDDETIRADEERFPGLSCGQAKGDDTDPDFIDPRSLPALPSLLRVRVNGRIEADDKACEQVGVMADRVRRTIEILRLNVERLQRARQRHRRRIDKGWQDFADDGAAAERWVRQILLPNSDGNLNRFFTTSRSYFGELGESVLAEEPRDWI